MPYHLHWLLELGQAQNLSAVVRGIKAASSHALGCTVWQAGFYDHALRNEDVKLVAKYIIANPLRAGLVSKIGDYPHWDVVWL